MPVIITIPHMGLIEAAAVLFVVYCGCMCIRDCIRVRREQKRQAARDAELQKYAYGSGGLRKIRD